jgi:hypothetical protein
MKKLNEDIIRKLIIETLEETKKKVEEVGEEGPLQNPEQDVAHGMESEPQPQDFGLDPEQFSAALEAVNSGDKMKELGGWSVLGTIADKIKTAIKEKEGQVK